MSKIRNALAVACAVAGGCSSNDRDNLPPDSGVTPTPTATSFVFVESNDPVANSVLVFARKADGTLAPAGQFPTGGKGLTAGPDQLLGPLDSDHELVLSDDGRFLYAVNSGDTTLAAYRVNDDGTLLPLGLSPFLAGGINPVSIGIKDDVMHVANKALDNGPATYSALSIASDGSPTVLADATVKLQNGASPTVAYVSPDGRFLFGTEFFDQGGLIPARQLDAMMLGTEGALLGASGSPFRLPADTSGILPAPPSLAQGLVAHPRTPILYVGFFSRSQLAIYTFDSTGGLHFVSAIGSSGTGISHLALDSTATHLYAVNGTSASISVFDLTDPLNPVERSALTLKQASSGPPFTDAAGATQTITSQPFQLALDANDSHLYVVSQRVTTNAADPTGNFLHTLFVGTDGSLSEPGDPIDLREVGVTAPARPQGVVVR